MPVFVNWLLRLLPTNPICMRLVYGGSRRIRHMGLRTAYLGIMMVVLFFYLLGATSTGAVSLRELAASGAQMFEIISYFQVLLICLLTPVFMAGAIAQEANPRTWDILLTTPLNSAQIVLGNLFGRLFFVVALLLSTMPLFMMTQYFGGVPGRSILNSYLIAGTSSLLVAAVAVTLSVTRTAGKRAVFIFYISVVMYLFVTFAIDLYLRNRATGGAMGPSPTTLMTPLNPFLALTVLLKANTYMPHDLTGTGAGWLRRAWYANPVQTFCWICSIVSLVLAVYCTTRLRIIGTSVGAVPWYRKLMRLGAKGANEREPRPVGKNPISWRESAGRKRTISAVLGRWSFVAIGIFAAIVMLAIFHNGSMTPTELRLATMSLLSAEVVIIALIALNSSATAVSREREDGTLDIILTTPIQPGPYIAGKLRGIIQFLGPLLLVPIMTAVIISVYMLTGGLGREGGVGIQDANPQDATMTFAEMPIVLPEIALILPLVLVPFIAFCVMVGLHWSIKSKGTISSVIMAVVVVLALVGVIGACAMPTGRNVPFLGGAMAAVTPINAVLSQVFPATTITASLESSRDLMAGRTSVIIGAAVAAAAYCIAVYAMHTTMKRTFMMTVRKLAGTS